jgi:hypothetical protein
VPEWLRPRFVLLSICTTAHVSKLSSSRTQSSIKHPVAVDFFAWPTLRDRLVQNHATIFQSGELSRCYSHYLRFDWPFSFEDTFFYDDVTACHYPSPLFERYHRDLKYWTVDPQFYEKFPEMRGDIEGDRNRFCEVEA